jgi:hypothetical protein
MNICIVHDSELGNGERLANAIRERLNSAGHTATVGHERTLTAGQALATRPDLLIVGSAIRRFMLSPVTKRWIGKLTSVLPEDSAERPRAVLFMTHAMSSSTAERWATRLRGRIARVLGEERVFDGWLSARVTGVQGPFEDGAEASVMEQIDAVVRWAGGN